MGRFLELSRKRIAIRADRSAHDPSIMTVIHIPDAVLPGLMRKKGVGGSGFGMALCITFVPMPGGLWVAGL